jgi:hypothetical protein
MWPNYETEILYWSNFLQLVFLPVITVGTTIMNRDSEKRAIEDHHTIRRQFELDDRMAIVIYRPNEYQGRSNVVLYAMLDFAEGTDRAVILAGGKPFAIPTAGCGNSPRRRGRDGRELSGRQNARRLKIGLPDLRVAENEQHIHVWPAESEVGDPRRHDLTEKVALRREHLHPGRRRGIDPVEHVDLDAVGDPGADHGEKPLVPQMPSVMHLEGADMMR